MNILEKIKIDLAKAINEYLKEKVVSADDIVYPPNLEMGDLSLPMFKIVKRLGKNPNELASEFISEFNNLKKKINILNSVLSAGAYLNFKLDKKLLVEKVLEDIFAHKKNYGFKTVNKKEKIMVEFSNVNTHKEYHLGHLRNISYGDSVNRILKANGKNSIPVSYVNDFGIHTAKTLWAFLEFYKDTDLPEDKGEFLGEVYARASKEAKDNKIAQPMIEGIMKKIESRKGSEYELWQKTREWSIEKFDQIYEELGVKFIKKYYESELIDEGFKMLKDLMKKNILKKSEGAVIADLEEYGLGVLVVLRSDGTATYPVADIPLASAKFKDYKLEESVYVVDEAQSLYFKQLFKILDLMGFKEKKTHLSYDVVKLPSGKMSSRLGNTVTYAEFKKKLLERSLEEIKKRHIDWNDEKINSTAWEISKGAMKFEMLKMGANQIITFDINKALSFSGFTSVYLQYTYARFNSIIRKTSGLNKKIDYKKLQDKKEYQIILKLAKYPEIIEKSALNYNPSEIAKYLFELAQLSNDFYHSLSILKAEEELKQARLVLIRSVNQVLKSGLDLLGIGVIEEM
jgi:arginyl-tRNA synthetase